MTELDTYKSLLETTRAIPWKIDWITKKFEYIGPQIEEILGWPPESWVTANDWIERIHPADREMIVDFCISQSIAGVDHEATYRAATIEGHYVWIRDIVHVIRDAENSTIALVGFMFRTIDRSRTNSTEQIIGIESQVFKLTKAEEKIITMLAGGKAQKQIASLLAIKHDTVRKHLKSIYRKTNTTNQSQLIKLMLEFPSTKVDLLNIE